MTFPTLSAKETVILRLLVPGGELYGLQLVTRSDGALKRGTVYTTLNRMHEKGLVSSRPEERAQDAVGIPRRLYKIEALGVQTLRALETAEMQVGLLTSVRCSDG